MRLLNFKKTAISGAKRGRCQISHEGYWYAHPRFIAIHPCVKKKQTYHSALVFWNNAKTLLLRCKWETKNKHQLYSVLHKVTVRLLKCCEKSRILLIFVIIIEHQYCIAVKLARFLQSKVQRCFVRHR